MRCCSPRTPTTDSLPAPVCKQQFALQVYRSPKTVTLYLTRLDTDALTSMAY